jgi:hypothetical protein
MKKEWMRMNSQSFNQLANGLINKEVEVITTERTFTGTLLHVGGDTIILKTRIRGRLVRIALRIALIVGLFRFKPEHRGHFWGEPAPHEDEESSEFREDDPQV